ncbi:hypothetical protein JXA56_04085 [Candidatus Micrarchaeota archaeon]|nr:hypothetical protein [Candidatus Micrarchaeota archaeon]
MKQNAQNGSGNTGVSPLREKHRAARTRREFALKHEEAKSLLLEGNAKHTERLASLNVSPKSRYEKIEAGEADYLLLQCSDSRVMPPDSEDEKMVGLQLRVAGNLVPRDGASREETREVASLVRPGGVIAVEAHCHCGAVNAHVEWEKGGRADTGIPDLNVLLNDVHGNDPITNLMLQGGLAATLTTNQYLALIYYDWEKCRVDIHSNGSVPIVRALKQNIESRQRLADDGGLVARLATQAPATIAVAYHKLPFSPNTIFRAEQGEIFSTTGSEGGLDKHDRASLLYSVEHCHSNHLAFIAPAIKSTKAMFDKWEHDIRQMQNNDGENILDTKLNSGELKITRFSYDLYKGTIVEV